MNYLLCFCLLLFTACERRSPSDLIKRCEQITGFDRLGEYVINVKSLHSASEGEYFLLTLSKKLEPELIKNLETKGFSVWARGGIEYGPINEGWDRSDDLIYSMIKGARETRLVAFSKTKGVLYIIYREK
ncbi:MAG: hypothetical protein SH807_03800 [Blastochloris sp.]|nr:hypothetical protein [Blastochloris sp.]